MQTKTFQHLLVWLSAAILTSCGSQSNSANDSAVKPENSTHEGVDEQTIPISPTAEELEGYKEYELEYLKLLRQNWSDVPSPITLTYEGYVFGDYEHIFFQDYKEGRLFDFGNGNNQLGKFSETDFLESGGSFETKKFNIHWDWKMSRFACCNGMNDVLEAKVPSILSLELID